jgi:hypothetical protein
MPYDSNCRVGCACAPLHVYVLSCASRTCTTNERYPSELSGQFSASMVVGERGSVLFLDYDEMNPSNGYCDPMFHKDTCVYFIAVMNSNLVLSTNAIGAVFSITAATSTGNLILIYICNFHVLSHFLLI